MSKVEIPSPPKRPTNAFFKFRKQVYDDVKAKNPEKKLTEHTKIITEMFRNLEEKKKKALEDQFHKELAIYKEEKTKYDTKYGQLIKQEKKAKKSIVSDTEEESHKKKRDKSKKAVSEDNHKGDKKGKKNGVAKKESKGEKEKKASKAEPEAKKGNKKK